MNRTIPPIVTAMLTLLLCSCCDKAEISKLRTDLEDAKKEAAEAKALAESMEGEIAKDKTDTAASTRRVSVAIAGEKAASETKTNGAAAKLKAAKDMAEFVERWNAVAATHPVELPNFGNKAVTFHWDGSHFPHPTFKLGTPEAYGAFAIVLLAFLENADNFNFLSVNRMFQVNLRSGVPGANGPDAGWTLAELVEQFSRPSSHGTHDPTTRKSLKALSDKIEATIR